MRTIWALATVAALTSIAGCSDPAPQSAPQNDGATRLLRLEISLTDSTIGITTMSRVSVPKGSAPIDSLAGNYMLVSYAGGKVHQAMPFGVPTELYIDGRDDNGRIAETLTSTGGGTTLFLDASVSLERIEILDESATVVATVDSKAIADSEKSLTAFNRRLAATPPEMLAPLTRLESEFPQIRFLDADYGDTLAPVFASSSHIQALTSIGEGTAEALIQALHRVPTAALRAVRTVGIATMEKYYLGMAYGGTLMLAQAAAVDQPTLVGTASHEATHNFQFLVDGGFGLALRNPDVWPSDVKQAADETRTKFALASGVTSAWSALHQTGVDLGVAGSYSGSDWKTTLATTAAQSGFASIYGSSEPVEDMAEYVERIHVPEAEGEGLVCAALRAAANPFPAALAVPLAKIKFLEALELLDATDVTACIGNPAIEGPTGIRLGDSVSFSSNNKAGWLDQDGGHFLAVFGDALPYHFMVRVLAPNNQALGIHRLDDIGFFNINYPNNAVYLSNDDEALRARTSAGGLVLVTQANSKMVQGAFFMLSLRNAAGLITDSFPLGTFSIPQ